MKDFKQSLIFAVMGLVLTASSAYCRELDAATIQQVTAFYNKVAADPATPWKAARDAAILKTQDDCGGRYGEPTLSVQLLESSWEASSTVHGQAPGNYLHQEDAKLVLLVIETAHCSVHHGSYSSVQNAVQITQEFSSSQVLKEGDSNPVSPAKETYKHTLGKQMLQDTYKRPYDVM